MSISGFPKILFALNGPSYHFSYILIEKKFAYILIQTYGKFFSLLDGMSSS